jgi:DNA-binding CsgD family transcriptional regulator/uncharacterized protein YuzE
VRIEMDPDYGLLYIELREGEAEQTLDLAEGVHLDLDAQGKALGLEFLSLKAFEHYMRWVGALEVNEDGFFTDRGRRVRNYAIDEARASLTPRQREVLELLAEGKTTHEVARNLHLSVATVRQHLRNAAKNLGVRGRDEAEILAELR